MPGLRSRIAVIANKCKKKRTCAKWHAPGGFCADMTPKVKEALENDRKCPRYRKISNEEAPATVRIGKGTPVAIRADGQIVMSDGSLKDRKDTSYHGDRHGWKTAGLKGDKTA
jgi:hypothetical protein